MQARLPRERTNVCGPSTTYVRTGDEGNKASFYFFPICGATVYYELEGIDAIAIPVGAFADSTFPAPKVAVYEVRRHPWVTIDGITERYD